MTFRKLVRVGFVALVVTTLGLAPVLAKPQKSKTPMQAVAQDAQFRDTGAMTPPVPSSWTTGR